MWILKKKINRQDVVIRLGTDEDLAALAEFMSKAYTDKKEELNKVYSQGEEGSWEGMAKLGFESYLTNGSIAVAEAEKEGIVGLIAWREKAKSDFLKKKRRGQELHVNTMAFEILEDWQRNKIAPALIEFRILNTLKLGAWGGWFDPKGKKGDVVYYQNIERLKNITELVAEELGLEHKVLEGYEYVMWIEVDDPRIDEDYINAIRDSLRKIDWTLIQQ